MPTPQESASWTVDDFFGLVAASPIPLDAQGIAALGRILSSALQRDLAVETVTVRLEQAVKAASPDAILTRRQAAQLLQAAGQARQTVRFLPTIAEAVAASDGEALNLLSQHFGAVAESSEEEERLDHAWRASQAVLTLAKASRKEQDEALKRLVDLSPRVRLQLGQAWLDESFTRYPERGSEILMLLGARRWRHGSAIRTTSTAGSSG
ncbi:MAG: hypothetical protein QM775_31765 [Pirellulales bacterium]